MGVHFADASGKPLTETKQISRWQTRADNQRRAEQATLASKQSNWEMANFPRNTKSDMHRNSRCYRQWLVSPKGTMIIKGEHEYRLGFILGYLPCKKHLLVRLVSRDPNFSHSQPVVVKREHIYRDAPGYLPPPKPQDQYTIAGGVAIAGTASDNKNLCNRTEVDKPVASVTVVQEGEKDNAPSPSTTLGNNHPRLLALKDSSTESHCVDLSSMTDGARKQDVPALSFNAHVEPVEQPLSITGGKYAGQKCIILKHLARRVRVQLLDSGRVTCISRGSLGLDEEKTVWHFQPRRSARIQAMKMVEGSTCRKSQSLAAGNPSGRSDHISSYYLIHHGSAARRAHEHVPRDAIAHEIVAQREQTPANGIVRPNSRKGTLPLI